MTVCKPNISSKNQSNIIDNMDLLYSLFENKFHQSLRSSQQHIHKSIFLNCHILQLYFYWRHKKCMYMHYIDSYHIVGHTCYRQYFLGYQQKGSNQNCIHKKHLKVFCFDLHDMKYRHFMMSKFYIQNYKLNKMIGSCRKIHQDSYNCW